MEEKMEYTEKDIRLFMRRVARRAALMVSLMEGVSDELKRAEDSDEVCIAEELVSEALGHALYLRDLCALVVGGE